MTLTTTEIQLVTESLLVALCARDVATANHSARVEQIALELGRFMNLDGEHLAEIKFAALLHDIGKLRTPDSILERPYALTDAEWCVMRQHPTHGADILRSLRFPQAVWQIVEQHHERWDGTGYPNRIAGENISFGARVVALADSYDAMTTKRLYQPTLTREQAFVEISFHSGTQFDPAIVEAFRDLTILNLGLTTLGARAA